MTLLFSSAKHARPNAFKDILTSSNRLLSSAAPEEAAPFFTSSTMSDAANGQSPHGLATRILPVDASRIGDIVLDETHENLLDDWSIKWDEATDDTANLQLAAKHLRKSDVPVAFPTETVYGLGADATRSDAVKGIYKAKQRPSDNPLIVHIASLSQLRALLQPNAPPSSNLESIPAIYKPLIQQFWPGPLTIIVPKPPNSILAPEVTAGLDTFGARMPRSILALALIKAAGVPLAAPSANASTKPSPTAAEHVLHDLNGRINLIIDGGPSDIGVESTVVDGLSKPPAILRPGGVSIEEIRRCPGWEDVVLGYKDAASEATAKPRAPGMKYRHYSPRAKVVLFEASPHPPDREALTPFVQDATTIGVIRTRTWPKALGFAVARESENERTESRSPVSHNGVQINSANGHTFRNGEHKERSATLLNMRKALNQHNVPLAKQIFAKIDSAPGSEREIWEVNLGSSLEEIGRGLFAALRQLDQKNVEVILVEGVRDDLGSVAAAIMNRLRKAASVKIEAGS